MTKEEAIQIVYSAFNNWEAEYCFVDDWSKEHEARDMAVNALEKIGDYRRYINALRRCAKEHEEDFTYTGCIRVSDLCNCTAILLESLDEDKYHD